MVKTYDPRKVLVSIGPHVVTGYSDGTFVSIEANGDGVTKKVGCDGEVVRSLDPDNTAKLTVTVQQQSPTVPYCQKLYDKDKATGDGIFPVLVKDTKGGLIFSAAQAWVVKAPNREFGKESADREIVIDTGDATWGGEK